MRTSKLVHIVSCHAEGEVGDVIVGGVAPPPGDTIWQQSRFIASDVKLRNFVLSDVKQRPKLALTHMWNGPTGKVFFEI